jgi:hypothetical protein
MGEHADDAIMGMFDEEEYYERHPEELMDECYGVHTSRKAPRKVKNVWIWVTEDGREIPITKMTDNHLRNTINLMARKGFISSDTLNFYLGTEGPSGDMAQMAFESELTYVIGCTPSEILGAMEKELKKRDAVKWEDMAKLIERAKK